MEFNVNEAMAAQLGQDMVNRLNQITGLMNELDGSRNLLHAALGDDAAGIQQRISAIAKELAEAYRELAIIIHDMNEYMALVKQTHVTLG